MTKSNPNPALKTKVPICLTEEQMHVLVDNLSSKATMMPPDATNPCWRSHLKPNKISGYVQVTVGLGKTGTGRSSPMLIASWPAMLSSPAPMLSTCSAPMTLHIAVATSGASTQPIWCSKKMITTRHAIAAACSLAKRRDTSALTSRVV